MEVLNSLILKVVEKSIIIFKLLRWFGQSDINWMYLL